MLPWRDVLYTVSAYSLAAYLAIQSYPEEGLFATQMIGTATIWVLAVILNNTSLYDPYWSLMPPGLLHYHIGIPSNTKLRLLAVAVDTWALRLTVNWFVGFGGYKGHEDFRYVDIRAKFKRHPPEVYWIVGSLGGLMVVPSIMTYLGCLPMIAAINDSRGDALFLDYLGAFVCVLGAAISLVADEQLRAFKRSGKNACIDSGLWRFSRHPNYLGELMFWLGLACFGLSVDLHARHLIGFLAMTLLFNFASIPLMEERMKNRIGYQQYKHRVSKLLFYPRK